MSNPIIFASTTQVAYEVATTTDGSNTATSFDGSANSMMRRYQIRPGTQFVGEARTVTSELLTENRIQGPQFTTFRDSSANIQSTGTPIADRVVIEDAAGRGMKALKKEITPTSYFQLTHVTARTISIELMVGTSLTEDADFLSLVPGDIVRLEIDAIHRPGTPLAGTEISITNATNANLIRDRYYIVDSINTTNTAVPASGDIAELPPLSLRLRLFPDLFLDGNTVRRATDAEYPEESQSLETGLRSVLTIPVDGDDDISISLNASHFITGGTLSWMMQRLGSETRSRSWAIKYGTAPGFTNETVNKYVLLRNANVTSYALQFQQSSLINSTFTLSGGQLLYASPGAQTTRFVTATTGDLPAVRSIENRSGAGGQLYYLNDELSGGNSVSNLTMTISAASEPIEVLGQITPEGRSLGNVSFSLTYSVIDRVENLEEEFSNNSTRINLTYAQGYLGDDDIEVGTSTSRTTKNRVMIITMPRAILQTTTEGVEQGRPVRQNITVTGEFLIGDQDNRNQAMQPRFADSPVLISFI